MNAVLLAATAVALQASSSITQRPATTDPVVIQIDQVDLQVGAVELAGSKVVVHEPGTYFIVAAPQVGRVKGGDPESFRCWLRVSGDDVANSNVLLQLGAGTKDVIVSQGVVQLIAGDWVEVVMAVSDPKDGIGVEAIEIPGEPLIPSIIFSLFKIGG
jgi:hypothetical protein